MFIVCEQSMWYAQPSDDVFWYGLPYVNSCDLLSVDYFKSFGGVVHADYGKLLIFFSEWESTHDILVHS